MTPSISIIIATYRPGHFLSVAITSALQQTFRDFEIIVSDDACDPAIVHLIALFGDQRIRYRSNQSRLGAAGNHWAAFRDARGEWLAILNHDDYWEADFLEKTLDALVPFDSAIIGFCDHFVIDEHGERLVELTDFLSSTYRRDTLKKGIQASFPKLVVDQTIPMAMGAVFRKSALLLDSLPEHAGPAYDLWLTYLLALSGGQAVYIPERLTSWRTHSGNLTSAGGVDWIDGAAECWAAMYSNPAFSEFSIFIRKRASGSYAASAWVSLKNGQRINALRSAFRAICLRPTNRKAFAVLMLTMVPMRAIQSIILRNKSFASFK